MRAVHWMTTRPYEQVLHEAVVQGAAHLGDLVQGRLISTWTPGCDTGDLMILVGLHYARHALAEDSVERGRRILHLDKGITRTPASTPGDAKTEYWRLSLDDHQPGRLLSRMPKMHPSRREMFGWTTKPWITGDRDQYVLVCPPGRRECLWYGLGDHVSYSEGMVKRAVKDYPNNDILFRPKPRHVTQHQWENPPTPAAWDVGKRPITETLRHCRAMYAYSTSATLDAVQAGVPIHVLGPNWAANLAVSPGTEKLPSERAVMQELNRLAYLQWSWEEWRDGTAWSFVKAALKY